MATESIMTKRPKAIPKTANETIDSENFREVPFAKKMRRAIKSSVFSSDTFVFFCVKVTIFSRVQTRNNFVLLPPNPGSH